MTPEQVMSRCYENGQPDFVLAGDTIKDLLQKKDIEAAIDRMGWPEINAFQAELKRGQDIREDAGGFMMRAIRRLFGFPPPLTEVETYQGAARKMVAVQIARETADYVIQYLEDEAGLIGGDVSNATRSNIANAILNGRASALTGDKT
jgi:hypothetical protein